MGHIYRLDFNNGKSYIGITERTVEQRFREHKKNAGILNLSSRRSAIYNAWRKHGAPQIVTLAVVENADLAATEIRAIAAYKTLLPNGYNTTEGGEFSPSKLASVREKISVANKGRLLGRVMPAETRQKISHALRNMDPEIRKIASEAIRVRLIGNKHTIGYKHTEESRRKISEAGMNRVCSEDTRAKLSSATKDSHKRNPRRHSEEVKAKISSSVKAAIAKKQSA